MVLLSLDVETTGIDCNKHRILQIGAIVYKDGKEVDRYNKRIKHDSILMDLGALKVNGVKPTGIDSLGGPGGDERWTANDFSDWLLQMAQQHGKLTAMGYNVRFDLNFIEATLARNGITGLDSLLERKIVDVAGVALTLLEAGLISDSGASYWNLGSIAKGLGLEVSDLKLHDAIIDAELTAKVYFNILELLKKPKECSCWVCENEKDALPAEEIKAETNKE